MVGAKTEVVAYISKIESHAHCSHCHGLALPLVVGETIKAIKIMRGILEAAFKLNRLIKYSVG